MNKIIYISPRDVRKNRSDAVHVMQSCNGFVENGYKVNLITPRVKRKEYKKKFSDIFSLYGLKESFKIIEMPLSINENSRRMKSGPFAGLIKLLNSFYYFLIYRKNINNSIIYSKCFITTVPPILYRKLGLINSRIIFETITPKNSVLHKFIFSNSDKIISHTKYSTEKIIELCNCNKEKIFEPPIPSQADSFHKVITKSKDEYKTELNLDSRKKIIMYAGKTGEGIKEVEYFIEAAILRAQYFFLIVGANEAALKKYEEIKEARDIKNLIIYPFQPLVDYYKFVKSADVLVDYYPATNHHKYFLSPGKAGAYLASKNPVIFSDLPSLRSLFPEDILYFCEPDNPQKLSEKIDHVIANPEETRKKAEKAYIFTIEHTYKFYAQEILKFILYKN